MDFFNDIFHNFALLEFYFLDMIYILLYIDFILSIFFQHSNILTRAFHHWCLASNIVLVVLELQMIWSRRQLTTRGGTRSVAPVVASRWHAPSVPEHLQLWHWLRLKPKFVFHLSFRNVLDNGRNVTYVTSSATGWNLGYLRSLPTRLFVQQHVLGCLFNNTLRSI